MRLVVSGYFGSGNLGDEALLAGMLSSMREAEPALDVTVVSERPDDTERTHGVVAVGRTRPSAILRAIRAADGLISGGGGLLQDRTSARPVAYYASVMGLAGVARRPYVIHAQGLGPISRGANRAIAAAALRGAVHVSLRDPESITLARALGVRRPIDLVPDPAVVVTAPGGNDGHVLVALRSWSGAEALLDPLRTALRQLAPDRGVLALPMHEPRDRPVAQEIVAGLSGAEIAPPDWTLHERLQAIGAASLVIGMRLHALVLAVAAGVPAVALSYDPKVDAFAARAGLEVAGSVEQGIDPEAVVSAAVRATSEDPTTRMERAEEMRRAARQAAAVSLAAIRGG